MFINFVSSYYLGLIYGTVFSDKLLRNFDCLKLNSEII